MTVHLGSRPALLPGPRHELSAASGLRCGSAEAGGLRAVLAHERVDLLVHVQRQVVVAAGILA